MRAEISATGNLSITAESELESWALKCWFAGYKSELMTDQPRITVTTLEIRPRQNEPT